MGAKRGMVVKNMYKGHRDKAKGGQDQGWEVSMGREGGSGGRKLETILFEQQKNVKKHFNI